MQTRPGCHRKSPHQPRRGAACRPLRAWCSWQVPALATCSWQIPVAPCCPQPCRQLPLRRVAPRRPPHPQQRLQWPRYLRLLPLPPWARRLRGRQLPSHPLRHLRPRHRHCAWRPRSTKTSNLKPGPTPVLARRSHRLRHLRQHLHRTPATARLALPPCRAGVHRRRTVGQLQEVLLPTCLRLAPAKPVRTAVLLRFRTAWPNNAPSLLSPIRPLASSGA